MKIYEDALRFMWKRVDGKDIPTDHVEELHDHALERIRTLLNAGHDRGSLHTIIKSTEYAGWWGD